MAIVEEDGKGGLDVMQVQEHLEKIDLEAEPALYDAVAKQLQTVADWSREDESRVVIGTVPLVYDVIERLVERIASCKEEGSVPDYKGKDDVKCAALGEQLCRLIGNLAFGNEENCDKFAEHPSILRALVAFIRQGRSMALRKNACAAIANLASDDQDMQTLLYKSGAVSVLYTITILKESTDDLRLWAVKALKNVIEDNQGTQAELNADDVTVMFGQLKQTLSSDGWIDNDFAKEIVKVLAIFSFNETFQTQLMEKGLLSDLLDLIDGSETQRAMIEDVDDEDLDPKADLSVGPLTADLISKIADKDKLRGFFKQSNVIERMMEIVTAKPPVFSQQSKKTTLRVIDSTKVKRLITKAVAYASLDDDIVETLSKYNQVFLNMFNEEDTEQIVSSAMLIGNLAVPEANCKVLLTLNAVEMMGEVMKTFPNHQPIQHLLLSAIRNCTRPAVGYKGMVASRTLIDGVISNMVVPNQVIQFVAISVLKHIIVSGDANFIATIEAGVLQPLVDLANGVTKGGIDDDDKTPKDPRVGYEATRLLIRFLQMRTVLHSESIKDEIVKKTIQPSLSLITAPWAILKSEGVKGLLDLLKINGTLPQIMEQETLWPTIFEALEFSVAGKNPNDANFNSETQVNVLELLLNITKDESNCSKLKAKGAVASLKELNEDDNATEDECDTSMTATQSLISDSPWISQLPHSLRFSPSKPTVPLTLPLAARNAQARFSCQRGPSTHQNMNEHLTSVLSKLETKASADGDQWRQYAYKRAVGVLRNLTYKVTSSKQIVNCRGIGSKIQEKIHEILQTGTLRKVQEASTDTLALSFDALSKIHGAGPETVKRWLGKGILSIDRVREINKEDPTFLTGPQQIGLKYYDELQVRIPRDEVTEIAEIQY
eukprot:gene4212-4907_t